MVIFEWCHAKVRNKNDGLTALGTEEIHGTHTEPEARVTHCRLLPGPREEFGKFLPESLNPSGGPKTSREGFARRGKNTGGIEISRPLILPSNSSLGPGNNRLLDL